MTRKGKIARLPHTIREEINSRLKDGEVAQSILAWVNALPQAQEILNKLFDGRPINQANMSDWKKGGYQDWLLNKTAARFADDPRDKATLGDLPENMATHMVQWIAIQYALLAKPLILDEPDPMLRLARLREMRHDAALLSRLQSVANRLQRNRSS